MLNKLTKIYKLMTVGASVGIIIKKDDLEQMGLKKGDMVKITIEKVNEYDSELTKHFKDF